MQRLWSVLACASALAILLSMSASPVMAQNVLWVGPSGSDGNTCSETSPCATFQGARCPARRSPLRLSEARW
jgi:hypothetical protein